MSNRRQSTNVKLQAIINSKNNDQEEEEEVKNFELKAKIRLRRTSLYNGGARTKIPKVKMNRNQIALSPFQLSDVLAAENGKIPKKFENSIPPGAHADSFRVVTNLTQRSFNDPDRICINSSSMLEGLHTVTQPRWYFGNTNKTTPSDTNMLIAAARYGFRGSKNIKQYNTHPYEEPSKTRTEYTPKFLDNGDFINEWVPPIIAGPAQSVNGIETPKLWPENTEYVHGYPRKKLPKSWRYKRETTVDLAERPKTSEGLQTTMSRISHQDDLLREYSRLESTSAFMSVPQTVQAGFESTWREKVDKLANSTLKYNLNRPKPTYEAHTLLDPSDVIKYSGTTAMIVHSQTTDELKFRIRMDRSKAKSNTPYALKWQHIFLHYRNIQANIKRNSNMDNALETIATSFEAAAIAAGSGTTLTRLDFITTCGKISFFDGMSQKQLSLLYSLFDPMKKNNMRFVEIVNMLTLINKPAQSPYEKLASLWNLSMAYGQDRNVLDMCYEILSTCCMSLAEQTLIGTLFKEEFRPRCYEMSMKHATASDNSGSSQSDYPSAQQTRNNTAANGTARDSRAMTANHNNRTGSPNAKSAAVSRLNTASTVGGGAIVGKYDEQLLLLEESMANAAAAAATQQITKKSTLSIQPQYNICEHYLNASTFIKVLKQCTQIVSVFDTQLSLQLTTFYGVDDRYQVEEVEVEENKDFTWIFKHKGDTPKRDVITLH